MTAVSIRKDYQSRLDSSDVVSVTKVLKLHILERKEQILLQGKKFVFSQKPCLTREHYPCLQGVFSLQDV